MAGDVSTPKVFNCPQCGSTVTVRAQGQTVAVACRSCGSIIDATDKNYQIISLAAKKMKIEPLLPLGKRGKLRGVLWEVIGFMERCDGSGVYSWGEYLLFNPVRGFRWLTEFAGHWNYIVTTKEKPTVSASYPYSAKYMGKAYNLFHKGTAKVVFVLGEFYWQVKADDTVKVVDYIAPPEILSCEKSSDEVIWSIGEYINSEEIRAAFQIANPLPIPSGVAPNQLSSLSSMASMVGSYWAIFIAVIFLIQLTTLFRAANEEYFSGKFIYNVSDVEKVKSTPQFDFKSGTANVDFALYAPVQNSWLEIEADLVNDETGAIYEFEQGVEYYSGSDYDGSWSEGKQQSHQILSSIPAGLYHLNIEAKGSVRESWGTTTLASDLNYTITVKRDVITWSNFFWALFLVSIFPAFVWWRRRSFEMARWSTSDFSPYWSQQEGEED